MTDRDRLIRLERIVFGDGVDEPGILTRLESIQQGQRTLLETLQKHIADTVGPSGAALRAMVLGALIVTGIGVAGQLLTQYAQPRAIAAAH